MKTERDKVLIELADYCCDKLRMIDADILIAKATDPMYDTFEKAQRVAKIEGMIHCYTELIKKLNQIKDRD